MAAAAAAVILSQTVASSHASTHQTMMRALSQGAKTRRSSWSGVGRSDYKIVISVSRPVSSRRVFVSPFVSHVVTFYRARCLIK